MPKATIQGSILIWSIFLVTFISFAFLYISTAISKSLDKNNQKIAESQGNNMIETYDITQKDIQINENKSAQMKFFTSFDGALGEKQFLDFSFLQENTGGITIKSGGPLYYEVGSGGIVDESGLIDESLYGISFPVNKKLHLENLGGLTQFQVELLSTSGVLFPYNYLQIKTILGGKEFIEKTVQK